MKAHFILPSKIAFSALKTGGHDNTFHSSFQQDTICLSLDAYFKFIFMILCT